MRIGVISDTHMPSRGKKLPEALVQGLRGVDLLLHAGDWTDPALADMLSEIAPVEGVAGNNDGTDIVVLYRFKKLLELSGYRIGLVHGHIGSGSTLDNAISSFREEKPDMIVFGHSHIPYSARHNGMLLFNPGSPTDKRFQPKYSFGVIELSEEGIKAAHVYYDSKL